MLNKQTKGQRMTGEEKKEEEKKRIEKFVGKLVRVEVTVESGEFYRLYTKSFLTVTKGYWHIFDGFEDESCCLPKRIQIQAGNIRSVVVNQIIEENDNGRKES
jgi:hypothetical protein